MVLKIEIAKDTRTLSTESTTWKQASPLPQEQKILSIACGNTSLNWALHAGRADNFAPILFWRTPVPTDDELKGEEPSFLLGRHLPPQAHQEIFGIGNSSTRANATMTSATRGAPALTVYVLSTNLDHERCVGVLFSEISHRFFRLESQDFFSKEKGCYATFGVDRAAGLFSAVSSQQHPAMVLDGGTAWTYTAVDKKGNIMGGGIAPGLSARFRCLADYCGKLPNIDYDTYQKTLNKALMNKAPLPIFAKQTETAIISSVFQEVTGQCRHLVKQFLQEMKKDDGSQPNGGVAGGPAAGRKPTILVTGGDSAFLMAALETPVPVVIPGEPGVSVPTQDFNLVSNKHLIHFGLGHLLKDTVQKMGPLSPDDQLRNTLVGQRIAKKFQVADNDGDFTYRGSIISATPGKTFEEDWFFVRYDDGDSEHYDLFALYEGLKLYAKSGEKSNVNALTWTTERRAAKQKGSEQAVSKLLSHKSSIKEHIEKAEKEKEETDKLKAEKAKAKQERAEKRKAEMETRAIAEAKAAPMDSSGDKKKRSASSTPGRGRPKKAKTPGKEDMKIYKGRRVGKLFPEENPNTGELEDKLYFGTVESFNEFFWHVIYDDDDEEDMDEKEIRAAVLLYDQNEDKDPKKPPKTKAVAAATAASDGDTPMADAPEASGTKDADTPMLEASTPSAPKDASSGATAPAVAKDDPSDDPAPAASKAMADSGSTAAKDAPSESTAQIAKDASPEISPPSVKEASREAAT